MNRLLAWLFVLLMAAVSPAATRQLIFTTGYANSRTPEVGPGIAQENPPIRAGGGFAAGARVDLNSPRLPLMFAPSILFWNNMTGEPNPNVNTNYVQIELGGRASWRTRTVPMLYAGLGVGYTFSHATILARATDTRTTYSSDFPTGSIHFGVKPGSREGFGVIAEASYHFGLDQPNERLSIGPARAVLIQIGVALDIISGPVSDE